MLLGLYVGVEKICSMTTHLASFPCVSTSELGPGLFITTVLILRSGLVPGYDAWKKVCPLILLLLLHLFHLHGSGVYVLVLFMAWFYTYV